MPETITANIDGQMMDFAEEAELQAHRQARRTTEPALLKSLRRHRDTAIDVLRQAEWALTERRGRTEGLRDIQARLRSLVFALAADIKAARCALDAAPAEEDPPA